MRDTDQNLRNQTELDALIELEYQQYREGKKTPLIGSGSKKSEKIMKENVVHGSPQVLTFGKIKQMNKSEENYQKLIEMLGCKSYEQALIKVDRVKKADKFLQKIKQMIQTVAPEEDPSLNTSWKILKQAISCYSLKMVRQE